MIPSTEGGGGSACSRCNHRHALPLQRDMANRWKSCSCLELEDEECGEFTLWLMASPMARMRTPSHVQFLLFVRSASILEIRILVSHNAYHVHTELFSLEYFSLVKSYN